MRTTSVQAIVLFVMTITVASICYWLSHDPGGAVKPQPADAGAGRPTTVARAEDLQLPPSTAPLKSSYKSLKALSAQGSKEASIRLFKEVNNCLFANRYEDAVKEMNEDKRSILNSPDAAESTKRQSDLAKIRSTLEDAATFQDKCEGFDVTQAEKDIYQDALAAARAGDNSATACLLIAPYESPVPKNFDGREYSASVLKLADDGLRQGSWPVVMGLTAVYSGNLSTAYSGFIVKNDNAMQLRLSALLRKGMYDGSPDAVNLDRRMSILAGMVTASEAREANIWADEMYRKYFFNKGSIPAGASACKY